MDDSSDGPAMPDRRWPRWVYGVGTEPDPRFSLANERTFLAWTRTGLAFIAAGVGLGALVGYVGQLGWEVRLGAVVLIACGLASGGWALRSWMIAERALRLGQPLPSSRVKWVLTGALVVVAALALVVLVR